MTKRFSIPGGALVAMMIATSAFAYQSPGNPAGYVNDFAGVLTNEEKATLETRLTAFHASSTVDIAIATVPTLQGEVIEDYANQLYREWGVGDKETNRGVLIVLARDERGVRIEVGYGLEGEITDAVASDIIRGVMVPAFKRGEYGVGLSDAVTALISFIETGNSGVPHSSPAPSSYDLIPGIFFLIYVVFSWSISIMSRTREWWLGGVLGLVASGALYYVFGSTVAYAIVVPLVLIGLCIDYVVSRGYAHAMERGGVPPWWTGGTWGGGGGGFGGGGRGFGGFGGGSSGGGGASGRF